MSKTQDFIFAFVERNYERQEEGGRQVLQSLPFFAASLGALLAGIGIIGTGSVANVGGRRGRARVARGRHQRLQAAT